jgi:hypothetical protein
MEPSARADVQIERRYLLPAAPPEPQQVPGERIQQRYVAVVGTAAVVKHGHDRRDDRGDRGIFR